VRKKIISCLLVLVFIFSSTVLALANVNDPSMSRVTYEHEGCCTFSNIGLVNQEVLPSFKVVAPNGTLYTLDEYLEILNSRYFIPVIEHSEIMYAAMDSGYMVSSSWPHTNCTNILGHSWPTWGGWIQSGSIRHASNCGIVGALCSMPVARGRTCQRANCTVIQLEEGFLTILCFM